ncbi:MAG TPA: YdeI/OmpD-associated family protein [Chitinophagaceae bacterium]|nr:YdeI/OmpD-associated family protein [Chitinophagaceae bacterium]
MPEYKSTHPKTRQGWRKWLEKNHTTSPGIWLIYNKKSSGKSRVEYNDAVEEALCFGWIDSTMRPLDEERFMQRFTPRKPKSGWSGINKERIKKMTAAGLMTPAGLAKIEEAKKDGSWQSLDAIYAPSFALELPPELEKMFLKNKKAKENFDNFSVSVRRQFLYWINSAKLPGTRKVRIKHSFLMAKANKRPGIKGFVL